MRLPSKASFATTLFAIFTSVFVSAQMYSLFQDSVHNSSLFNAMEAFGAIFMGFLSDKFCRRKTNILSHFIGLCLLILIYFHRSLLPAIFLLGFFYNPLPILRAGLVDNFTRFPRLYLLMISFVIQFLPWSFYSIYVATPTSTMLHIAIGMLTVSFIGTFFFFRDKRDLNIRERSRQSLATLVHSSSRKRVLYTVIAFFLMQGAYFFTDNLQENMADLPGFYSVISAATTVCVLLALTFRDISHVSVLRVNYGINAALSCVPLLAIYLFKVSQFDTSFLIIMLSGFSAFTLPFVYDITMNSINANYRGSACGVLDFAFSAASLFSASIINLLNVDRLFCYSIITIGLFGALYFQTKAEKKPKATA